FTIITDTSTVSGRSAALNTSRSIRPLSLTFKYVTSKPWRSSSPQYFNAADIYTHPTLNDSYGMAPLEAMSHGLPVIVSSPVYCGFAQYLTAGTDALILQDPRDGAQLAQALESLGSDPQLRAALTSRGLEIARDQSWETVASRYEALYEQVLLERH
ncbi:transferase, partial [Achromobacter sp. KAs 3-5]